MNTRRWTALAIALLLLVALGAVAFADVAGHYVAFHVKKEWVNDVLANRPTELDIQLHVGSKVYNETLCASGNWEVIFNVPENELVDFATGQTATLTVKEVSPVAGYTTTYTQPVVTYKPFLISDTWEKTSPDNSLTWDLGGKAMVFKKGHEFLL